MDTEALKKSEEKYRSLIENSLQGFAVIQDSRIVFCNEAYASILGYPTEELLALSDTKAIIHPDEHELVFGRYRDRLAGVPVPERYEHRIIRKDGTERWVEIYSSRIEYGGKPAVQIVDIDITERKLVLQNLEKSRDYLDQIINCIGDPIFVKDRQHRFVLVNNSLCKTFGIARENLIGRTSADIFPNEPSSLLEQEEKIFQTGTEYVSEHTILDKHGNPLSFMANKTLLTAKDGTKQIIGVLRDLTEIKRLQGQFLEAQKMEAIASLAGGVAHDFNNQLSVIRGYAELLLDDLYPDDPRREDLEQIAKAGQRAGSLVSQLLAFSRRQILQPEILNLNTILADMTTMLRRMLGEHIELSVITSPDLGSINVDPAQIQQVLINIAVNARDAMLQGGSLVIETSNVQLDEACAGENPVVSAGSYVMVTVTDNGTGMDLDTQAHMFEPFFTTKGKTKAAGLGLSTAYGIIKQSNGFISVDSELGKGTKFKIYLPRVKGMAFEPIAFKNEPAVCETVLLVEDEESVRSLASRILQARGYKVLEAAESNQALHLAQEFPGIIHLVLTDVILPGRSGKALVSEIEAMRPGIKSLFFSGYPDNAITKHGILETGVAFLPKPFTVEGLIRKVREIIRS